jgi:8-oxo-dGTP pyrophosphatase MutT (NUDIX family)
MTNTPAAGTMKDARLVETEILLPKPKRFVRETLVMPDGYECDWYYVDTPPSVMIVPVTIDQRLVLVRQYRHDLKSYQLEFPAGTMHETDDPEDAACRELEEETRLHARHRLLPVEEALSGSAARSRAWRPSARADGRPLRIPVVLLRRACQGC